MKTKPLIYAECADQVYRHVQLGAWTCLNKQDLASIKPKDVKSGLVVRCVGVRGTKDDLYLKLARQINKISMMYTILGKYGDPVEIKLTGGTKTLALMYFVLSESEANIFDQISAHEAWAKYKGWL